MLTIQAGSQEDLLTPPPGGNSAAEAGMLRAGVGQAIAVLVALVAAPAPALADDLPSAWDSVPANVQNAALDQLPDSNKGGRELLLNGSLNGFTKGKVGRVFAQAWPNSEELSKMQPGDSFSLLPIARATVRGDGTFQLFADPATLDSAYVGPNGELNLNLVAWDGVLVGEEMVATKGRDMGHSEDLGVSMVSMTPRGKQGGRPAARVIQKPWTACSTTLLQKALVNDVIGTGKTADTSQGSSMSFKASQTVINGVAFDLWYDSIGWQAGGTSSVSTGSSFSVEWAKSVYDRDYALQAQVGKYREVCYYEPSHQYMYTKDTWRTIQLTGGYTTLASTTFTASYCTSALSAGTWTRSSSSGTSFKLSTGLKIGSTDGIGFNVSSESNYDSNNALTFHQPTSGKYKLCGDTGYPSSASRVRGVLA